MTANCLDLTDQHFARSASTSLPVGSDWCRWTEAACDQCLIQLASLTDELISGANTLLSLSALKEDIFSIYW